MSLKLRLNLMITALLAMLMMVGTLMLIHNARGQVLAEVDSTAALATHLLDAETIYFSGITKGEAYHKPFRLQGLEHLRHLRIEFRDTSGRLLDSNQSGLDRTVQYTARLVYPGDDGSNTSASCRQTATEHQWTQHGRTGCRSGSVL